MPLARNKQLRQQRRQQQRKSQLTGDPLPHQWLIVAYDVPNEPSKFRVKVWRDLKSHGGLYPQMSFCILPYSSNLMTKLKEIRPEVEAVGGMLVLQTKGFTPIDNKFLQSLMNKQSERQYLEILEECQEFLDEIKSNITQKVFKDEEIQELDEGLEGLNRWFNRTLSFDKQRSSRTKSKVKGLLERCQKELDSYAAIVESLKKSESRTVH